MKEPEQRTQAGVSAGSATDSIADVESCRAACWPDPDTITYTLTGWERQATCGTCGRTLARKEYQALGRQVQEWAEL